MALEAVSACYAQVTNALAPTATVAKTPATAAKPVIVPLQANGLVERALRGVGTWFDGLGTQSHATFVALRQLLTIFERSGSRISDITTARFLLDAGGVAVAVFGAALIAEWLLHALLRFPLKKLCEHADAAEQHDVAAEARRQAEERVAAEEARTSVATDSAACTQPSRDDVALMHSHQDGVDRVEEVRVGSHNTDRDTAPANEPSAEPPFEHVHAKPQARPAKQVHTLRRFCYALLAWMMNMAPLALFFFVAGLAMRMLANQDERAISITSDIVNAYLVVRVMLATLRLLVSPMGPGLRVVQVGHENAVVLQNWMRAITIFAAFGMALATIAETLGATHAGHLALLKLISLFVHVAVALLILRMRGPMRRMIAGSAGATGPIALTRRALARAWAPFAIVLVMGVWVVWALGVEDGFPKLLHFIGVTAAILVVARILSILLQGLLGRAFHFNAQLEAAASGLPPARVRLTKRYYPFVRGLASIAVTFVTIIALLQAWGLNAISWFAQGGLGRGLTSALITILLATVITIAIWEAVSVSMERRITAWSESGDNMRAARLRTLMPMLRTCLLVCVVLVIGLTALNQIGINTTPLLASASIVGVALGFGSQKLVQDFITGIFLLMENAMQVGDWITVAGVSGTVETLSVRTVRLRGGDGSLYTVPFSSVTTVNNTNRGLGNAAVSVSVSHENDIERAIVELKAIGKDLRNDLAFKDLILKDIEVWGVDSMDGSRVTLIGQVSCTDSGRWGVQREINRRIIKRFREKNIELANPRASLLVTPHGATSSLMGKAGGDKVVTS